MTLKPSNTINQSRGYQQRVSDKSQRTPTPPGLLGGHPACENPLKSHLGRVPPLSKPPPRLRYPGGNGQLCWKAPAQGPPGAGPAGPQVVPPRREGRPDTKHRPPGPHGPQSGANSTPGRVSHAAVPGGGSGARRGEEGAGAEATPPPAAAPVPRGCGAGPAAEHPPAAGPRCAPRRGRRRRQVSQAGQPGTFRSARPAASRRV